MTLRDRISLTWNYGKTQLLIGAVYNLFCFGLLAGQFSYTFFVDSFILKAVLLPIVLFLLHLFRDRDAFFFYTNPHPRGPCAARVSAWVMQDLQVLGIYRV